MFQLIMISLVVVAVLVGVVLVMVRKNSKTAVKKETDYQAFFTMGLSFIAMGTILSAAINPNFLGFLALGIIYLVIGLKNKDKWKKKQ